MMESKTPTPETNQAERKTLDELYEKYISLLNSEIKDLIGIANVHGWKSQNVDKGIELRNKILKAKSASEPNTLDEADNVVPKSISKVVNGNIIVIDQYPDKTNELIVSVFKGTEQVIPTFGEDTLEAISRLLDCLEQSVKTSDYKKQINELQSALGHQKHLNNAMAKGLMPKELIQPVKPARSLEEYNELVARKATDYLLSNGGYLRKFAAPAYEIILAYSDGYEASHPQPLNTWIKVSERLPELDRSVWIAIGKEVWPAYYWNFCGKDLFHCNEEEVFPEYWKYSEDKPEPPTDINT